MTIDLLKRFLLFIVFVLAQALVFGRIHLFHYATPLLYVYFVTMFPRNYPKWAVLTWGFVMGLLVDIFYNTPGVASASLTLIAAVQPYFFSLFVSRDAVESLEPSLLNLGPIKYSYLYRHAGAALLPRVLFAGNLQLLQLHAVGYVRVGQYGMTLCSDFYLRDCHRSQ